MGFYVSLLFLTRLPLPQIELDDEKIASSLPFFPVAGAVIGGFLALVYVLAQKIMPLSAAAGIATAFHVAMTGGMHLDGFADTTDAIFCYGDREKKLAVMKDSCSGAYGVIGIVLIILLKFLFIFSLPEKWMISSLVCFPVISRWIMTYSMVFYPYIRKKGLGKAFTGQSMSSFIIASIFTLLIIYFTAGLKGIAAIFLTFLCGFAFIKYIIRQFGGMTGDTYGATNEFCETVALLIFLIISFKIG